MPKSLGLSSIRKTFERKIAISETKFHRGSLRSGQKLETEGSIIILGDVNSGNLLLASNKYGRSTVEDVAVEIDRATGNIVKEIDREEEPLHKQAYISVVEDKIVIE